MSIFVWNCQGAAANKFHTVLRSFIQGYKPDVVVLVEPRISGLHADKVVKKIGLPRSHRVEANGFSGGIWLLWSDRVEVKILVNPRQFIHSVIKMGDEDMTFLFTAIYGSPNPALRESLWQDLSTTMENCHRPWLLAGDFNATLQLDDRKGGARRGLPGCASFQSFVQTNSLIDLGFVGPKYTWRRGTLLVRFDRALANSNWAASFPCSTVHHLPKLKSDHRPLLVNFGLEAQKPRRERPFKFLASWVCHPQFNQLVRESWADDKKKAYVRTSNSSLQKPRSGIKRFFVTLAAGKTSQGKTLGHSKSP